MAHNIRRLNLKNIKLVIFDFDGTLAQTKNLYFKLVYRVVRKSGYGLTRKDIQKVLGKKLTVLLKELGIKSEREIKRLRAEINKYALRKSSKLKACPSVEIVNNLNLRKALVTNSLTKFTQPLIRTHRLKFDVIMGADKFKTKPDAFRLIFRKFKIKPKEAVYIGDRPNDVKVARKAGCRVILVSNKYSWSKRRFLEKAKPDAIIRNLKELNYMISD